MAEYVVSAEEVSFAYRELSTVPLMDSFIDVKKVKKVDLTETNISNYENLGQFTSIEVLILDKNELTSIEGLPLLDTLHTLWVNNNNIDNLELFMDCVCQKYKNLKYLSLMRNPCCPSLYEIEAPDLESMKLHRLYILYRLPSILMLDWTEVTKEESTEAKIRGQYAVKRKSITTKEKKSWGESILGTGKVDIGIVDSADVFQSKTDNVANIKSKICVTSTTKKFESKHSEGNRFIVNAQL